MAARFPTVEHRNSNQFSAALSSAALEWVLILLLFLDASFSYVVTKFARACKLQIPCLLCSRLDHILGNEKPGFYRNLICTTHKLEISSLAFCHIHQKLADVHDMCERCLLSFATEKKSNSETYRALVGKLGIVIDDSAEDDVHDTFQGEDAAEIPLLEDSISCYQVERDCSCCSEPLNSKTHAIKLFHKKSGGVDVADTGHTRQHHETSLEDTEGKSLESKDVYHLCTHDVDPLCHIGYSEVKITSDSESDIPSSDDEARKELVHNDNDLKEAFVAQGMQPEAVDINSDNSSTTFSDVTELEKLIPPPVGEPFGSIIPDRQLLVGESHDISSLASAIATEHVLDELHYSRDEEKAILQPAELILEDSHKVPSENSHTKGESFSIPEKQLHVGESHDISSLASAIATEHAPSEFYNSRDEEKVSLQPAEVILEDYYKVRLEDSRTMCESFSIPEKQLHVGESIDNSSLVSAVATEHASAELYYSQDEEKASLQPVELIHENKVPSENSHTKDNFQQDLVTSSGEFANALNSDEVDCKTNQIIINHGPSLNTDMSLNDAYKLAIGNKDSFLSPTFAEVIMGKDSSRAHEDLKLLISQISASQGLESPWNYSSFSPRVHGQDDYFVLQNITKKLSIERNESGMESLEGSIVSEIEGENPVDRLRRQVALDRKSISLLYRELEEERNASAIAANQAMAMITRLQEEKAAMQMEALHYQRMMEEQAEYDHEAMQKYNVILAQKDKELQELEVELEKYRIQFRGELSAVKPSEARKPDPTMELEVPVPPDMWPKCSGSRESSLLKYSQEGFDDEKAYILNCLKRLEQKLHMFSNNGLVDVSKFSPKEEEFSEKTYEDVHGENSEQRMPIAEDNVRRNCRHLVYVSSEDIDSLQSIEDPNSKTALTLSTMQAQHIVCRNQGEGLLDNKGPYFAMIAENDLAAFEDEISELSERLTILEADRNFMEHSVNSLRNGDEGVQLIQEIARHLRELRAIGTKQS